MIPSVDDLSSAPMVHRFGDMFNLPGLTNFLGCVQVDSDITGIRSLNFPPYATSDTISGCLYVDGRFFKSTGTPITFTWYPDRILREAEYRGIKFRSVTILAVRKMAALVRLDILNGSGVHRDLTLKFGLRGGVTRSTGAWTVPPPPSEEDNIVTIDSERGLLVFKARTSQAVSCQGVLPRAGGLTEKSLHCAVHLGPGERTSIAYVNAIGGTENEARELLASLLSSVDAEIENARNDWNLEIHSIFTPGNDRYSGFLPILETGDPAILRSTIPASLVLFTSREIRLFQSSAGRMIPLCQSGGRR